MENYIERFENEKYRLTIYQDSDVESPRTWDNLGKMVCWHRNYKLGDKHSYYDSEEFFIDLAEDLGIDTTYDEYNEEYGEYEEVEIAIEDIIDDIKKEVVILQLYLYDHSGISIKIQPHGYHAAWDCGKVGYIYITHEDIIKEYGEITEENIEKAKRVLEGEVETYSQYLEGDIYGYILEEKELCEHCGHMEYEDIDSCWGFYGSDFNNNGLFENVDLTKENLEELKKNSNAA